MSLLHASCFLSRKAIIFFTSGRKQTENSSVKLRPHHILCTRAFCGHGYSPSFVKNLHRIIERIQSEREVNIISGCDDICALCPKKCGEKCADEKKVQSIDDGVRRFFGIQNRTYAYGELESAITKGCTPAVFEKICAACEWKKTRICTHKDVLHSL